SAISSGYAARRMSLDMSAGRIWCACLSTRAIPNRSRSRIHSRASSVWLQRGTIPGSRSCSGDLIVNPPSHLSGLLGFFGHVLGLQQLVLRAAGLALAQSFLDCQLVGEVAKADQPRERAEARPGRAQGAIDPVRGLGERERAGTRRGHLVERHPSSSSPTLSSIPPASIHVVQYSGWSSQVNCVICSRAARRR